MHQTWSYSLRKWNRQIHCAQCLNNSYAAYAANKPSSQPELISGWSASNTLLSNFLPTANPKRRRSFFPSSCHHQQEVHVLLSAKCCWNCVFSARLNMVDFLKNQYLIWFPDVLSVEYHIIWSYFHFGTCEFQQRLPWHLESTWNYLWWSIW